MIYRKDDELKIEDVLYKNFITTYDDTSINKGILFKIKKFRTEEVLFEYVENDKNYSKNRLSIMLLKYENEKFYINSGWNIVELETLDDSEITDECRIKTIKEVFKEK